MEGLSQEDGQSVAIKHGGQHWKCLYLLQLACKTESTSKDDGSSGAPQQPTICRGFSCLFQRCHRGTALISLLEYPVSPSVCSLAQSWYNYVHALATYGLSNGMQMSQTVLLCLGASI